MKTDCLHNFKNSFLLIGELFPENLFRSLLGCQEHLYKFQPDPTVDLQETGLIIGEGLV